MVEEMTVVDKPWELDELVFRNVEVWVGVRHVGRVVLCARPPDSHLNNSARTHQRRILPSSVPTRYRIRCQRPTDIFVLAVWASRVVIELPLLR
jgi:hypothetical protein